MEPVELTTPRLRLRPWQPGDAPAVLAACADPQIQEWTTVPSPYTERDAAGFVGQVVPQQWADGSGTPFAVVQRGRDGGRDGGREGGLLLAAAGLVRLDLSEVPSGAGGSAEVGFWCAAPARGRGVVTEAVDTLARWAFAGLGVARLEWRACVGNAGSRRVAEKVGFRFEGVARAALVLRGRRRDAQVGALLPGDLPER